MRGWGGVWSGLLLIPGAAGASCMLEIEIEIGIQPITKSALYSLFRSHDNGVYSRFTYPDVFQFPTLCM